ncbi:MAG TPA: sugar phosphate isomerase/epimerase [Terriglobia bacterium]|nr:sugar phosphate isomerase/epimerase [Terriglobia bacterium]
MSGTKITISRRGAVKTLVAATAGVLAAARWSRAVTRIDSVVRGVQIGAQSYSFRDRPLDAAVKAYQDVGLGQAELWQGHLEPDEEKVGHAALRAWRLNTPLSFFREVRTKFDQAGVELYAYNYSFDHSMNDAEIRRGFEMAKAMAVRYITASSNVSLAPAIDKLATEYRITVGFHGHDDTSDPDQFSTAETFERALKGASRYLAINLDIGHFVAANGDPVAFIKQYHDRIVTLHIKDRKKNHGDNLPFGQGQTPIVAVLHLLRDHHWRIPANIEYEYGKPGMDTVAEVKKCYAYCRQALES